jgi:hypothetical protein
MTDEELSKLIGEFLPYPSKDQHYALRSFARIVAAAEREACAALCDKIADDDGFEGGYANHCAFAIRERGAP